MKICQETLSLLKEDENIRYFTWKPKLFLWLRKVQYCNTFGNSIQLKDTQRTLRCVSIATMVTRIRQDVMYKAHYLYSSQQL